MNKTHIIFLSTKGGVGKSTLTRYTHNELTRLGYIVNVFNCDQQNHVDVISEQDPHFCIYDTAGAFTGDTVTLLQNAAESTEDNVQIVIPTGTGANDRKELPFIINEVDKVGLLDKTTVVITRTRVNSKARKDTTALLQEMSVNVSPWWMPTLEDFSEQRDTSRTRNEISSFIMNTLFKNA